MAVSEPWAHGAETTMLTMALSRPAPGVFRMTSLIAGAAAHGAPWDASTVEQWLAFPGVHRDEYAVRRLDAARGIVEIEFFPRAHDSLVGLWLDTVRVGARHRIGGPSREHLPRFGAGKRVYMFADETAMPAVGDVLNAWPPGAVGTLWIDTPHPAAVARLPAVDGVGVISFHVAMGFDPLVTAARRLHLDHTTTVWGAGENARMDAIRSTCHAAGLSSDDSRVFGYWSAEPTRRRG